MSVSTRISTRQLRRMAWTAAAANLAATLCTLGGWAHLWTFTHAWQFHTAAFSVAAAGLFSALALLRRVRQAREVSR